MAELLKPFYWRPIFHQKKFWTNSKYVSTWNKYTNQSFIIKINTNHFFSIQSLLETTKYFKYTFDWIYFYFLFCVLYYYYRFALSIYYRYYYLFRKCYCCQIFRDPQNSNITTYLICCWIAKGRIKCKSSWFV